MFFKRMFRKGAAQVVRLRGNRVRITGCRATVSSQCFCAESHWVYKPEKAHKREQARKPAFPECGKRFRVKG